jgi:hypothetical protein
MVKTNNKGKGKKFHLSGMLKVFLLCQLKKKFAETILFGWFLFV